jgi:hypothetical protein
MKAVKYENAAKSMLKNEKWKKTKEKQRKKRPSLQTGTLLGTHSHGKLLIFIFMFCTTCIMSCSCGAELPLEALVNLLEALVLWVIILVELLIEFVIELFLGRRSVPLGGVERESPSRSAEETPSGNNIHMMDPADGEEPSNTRSSNPRLHKGSETSNITSESGCSRDKSALEETIEDFILSNLKDKKGDLGDGQRLSNIRREVENNLDVHSNPQRFSLCEKIKKEAKKDTDNPVTKFTFREVEAYQSKKLEDKTEGKGSLI